MLKVEKLTKSYGDFEVLKGIDFEIEKGTIYGFLGRNGAGKTTTMNILSGLIEFNSGRITYKNQDFKTNKRAILREIGYVPQDPAFYGYMNAREYLKFMGEIGGMSSRDIKDRTEEVLSLVGIKEAANRKVGGYSGGMQQRLAIAVALFNRPEMLFLDEPTSSLDPEGRMEILSLMANLRNEGMTIFLSTHILNDIERICDRVSILDEGRIIVSDDLKTMQKKYILPIFDIELDKPCETLEVGLKNISSVEKIEYRAGKLEVYVTDIQKSRNEVLKCITDCECSLTSFTQRKSNLEDIFIRLVNKNENI